MRVFAPAKINLFLAVIGKLDNGYHALESLVVFAEAGDWLLIEPAQALSLAIDGPFAAALPDTSGNLVMRAARALASAAKLEPRARLTLTKNLPVASGIGGGSADAAAALHGLSEFWALRLGAAVLPEIALSLGSDVPVCLFGKPAWLGGRGEKIAPGRGVPTLDLVLVNPGVEIATAEVFRRLGRMSGPSQEPMPPVENAKEFVASLARMRNDLESAAREIAPQIGGALTALSASGAMLARMSGSGATCFGIFEDATHAARAAAEISKTHPGWWVAPTRTAGS